jgi:S-adenosyl-L-methionine hydrolase (adenosine-forming)
MNPIAPAGVITITTDFGHKGPFAAIMKGVILTRFPAARIIDLAHDIPPHWPPEAGFWLSKSYRYFPQGTVHVGIVDPGVGTEREIIVAEIDSHVFLGPDNGLLAPLLAGNPSAAVYFLDVKGLERHGVIAPSLTFHGRDIFAPVAAELAAGRLTAKDLGSPTREWTPGWLEDPAIGKDRVSGVVVTVDAFGNLISNIDASLFSHFASPLAQIGGHNFTLMPTYGRAKPGDYLALINSFGVLEIARAEGSAAEGLGADRGAPVVVRDAGAAKA